MRLITAVTWRPGLLAPAARRANRWLRSNAPLQRSLASPLEVRNADGRVPRGPSRRSSRPPSAGTVVDPRSLPIAGARVAVVGGTASAVTDPQGRFRLAVTGDQVTLRASMIGYRPAERVVRAAPGGPLCPRRGRRQPGRGRRHRKAPNRLPARARQRPRRSGESGRGGRPAPNVQDLLSKGVAGVRVMSSGGDVGSGGNIRIRGSGSLALSTEPLLYIDGVRVNNTGADAGGVGGSIGVDSRYAPSRINDLTGRHRDHRGHQGPAAATLYGTEASNGVVNIITKKGRRGRRSSR